MVNAKRVFGLESPHGTGGLFFCWQKGNGNYLVTTGYNQIINIYDRHGQLQEQLHLQGLCSGFGWDKDGDMLAVINDKTPILILWDSNTKKIQSLDTNLREAPSLLVWSKTAPFLTVATTRGNLMIYNHKTSRRIPVIGKHTKRITCGAWSSQNLLATGGEDKILSISNHEGDTVRQAALRADPSDIQFSEMKHDERSTGENTVSMVVGKKTLYLFNLNDPDNPIELAFQQRYGNIVAYKWFGDGYMLLGFSTGYFVVISTHMKEIGQELFQVKNHRESLVDIAISTSLGKAASAGDNVVKIHELNDLKNTWGVITLEDERGLEWIDWSEDGQVLAVATSRGNLHVYLTKLPQLGDCNGSRIAYLTSLLEVTIVNQLEKEAPVTLTVDVEPSFLGVGPFHLMVGMNNRAWIYGFSENGGSPEMIRDREYLGTVSSVHLNADYAAVLYDGKIQLHMLEAESGEHEERESRLFPDSDFSNQHITCHALTQEFLIYGTDTGGLYIFFLEDWCMVTEYSHLVGLREIYPETNGPRLLIIDNNSEPFLYNPVNDETFPIPGFPSRARGVLWESWHLDKNVFVVYDDKNAFTFIFARESINGPQVELVGQTPIPMGTRPLLLYNGELSSQTSAGTLATLMLSTHDSEANIHDYKQGELREVLKKNLKLRRFKDSWEICRVLNKNEDWKALASAAMTSCDVDMAIRAYRQMGDVGMVWSLTEVRSLEDAQLLAGHLAMFLGDFNLAQDLYLRSAQPQAALEMRRDLLHWDQALQLANKLAPDEIPSISREYAQQLEFTGDYPGALLHFEKGFIDNGPVEHNDACHAGVARTAIRCGDIRRGTTIAKDHPSISLKRECAEILEGLKQYSEAATLFEKGGYHDKAAGLYIRLKNWHKVAELLPHVTSPKIHIQFAKAKEADGKYKEAAAAYETARDWDNLIRVLLDHLSAPEKAVKVVRETKNTEGAYMVARFFMKLNDWESAIQFLVLSKCTDEAFKLAQQYGKMSLYAQVIGTEATPEEYRSIALHFESDKNHLLAGKFFHLAGKHQKALKHLIRVAQSNSEDKEALSLAIEVVASSNDDMLARQLIDFLLGENDGIPKDLKYLFRLYMARKQYREAAKTAVIIAKEEQDSGNYRSAHDVLYGMFTELRKQNIHVPMEMNEDLLLLHSYILVRIHVRLGQHTRAARMLMRVGNSISRFPVHIVPILTSTVIECHRAGLKQSAFHYATMLLRPEYREQIDAKYKSKIEAIVRRRPKEPEEEEARSTCPHCEYLLPESELKCPQCKNTLPFCIITGCHVVRGDLTCCPDCKFPAMRSEFLRLVEAGESCPMCDYNVVSEDLVLITDPTPYLNLPTDS